MTPTARAYVVLIAVLAGSAGCSERQQPTGPVAPAARIAATVDKNPWAPGLFVGYTAAQCLDITSASDLDQDGVTDHCERTLAAAFAPLMHFASDCSLDGNNPAGVRLGGDYGYAVQQVGGKMRVAYLPAYYADCGREGGVICSSCFPTSHRGDSEAIGVELAFDPSSNHWLTQRVFTSAHCGELFVDGNCAWWGAWRFRMVNDVANGAPRIWVARGKHANYWSEDECNSQLNTDVCVPAYSLRFPIVYAQQNIGSGDRPNPWSPRNPEAATQPVRQSCQKPLWPSPLLDALDPAARDRLECWWARSEKFFGWLGRADEGGSTPHGDVLSERFGMRTGQRVLPPEPGDVQISGSSAARPGQTCGYIAYVRDDDGDFPAPYLYAWGTDGLWYASGDSFSFTHESGSTRIMLSVAASNGTVKETSKLVTTDPDGSECLSLGDEVM